MPKVTTKTELKRSERLALHLADLDRLTEPMRAKLLGGKLEAKATRMPDGEAAVALSCGLVSAAVTVDLIRSADREAGDAPTRAYVYRREWQKLPGQVVLTAVVGGAVQLSPAIFSGVGVSILPPQAKRVEV